MHFTQSGIDVLLAQPPAWRHSKIALVTNHAATTHRFQPSRMALLQAGFNVVKLFSPEHGLDITGADGHIIYDGFDPLTDLPVISLYGDKLSPTHGDLKDIDLVLFDIPDIGCRFYTYLWTMTYVMEACATYKIPFMLADRPNPLSGNLDLAEGPMLDDTHCSSFIGRWQMPVRHSCTLGELAGYFNTTRKMGCQLEIITCNNWRRHQLHIDWCSSFIPTSPAIPGFESALLYPGLCFLEATNISEGRGTAFPFRVAGAPWMEAERTAELFNSMTAAGTYARPLDFTPLEGKYAGHKCKGIMLHISAPHAFQPVATGWLLIRIVKDLHPGLFAWAPYPTHVNHTGKRHLDLLSGLAHSEQIFESDLSGFPRKINKYTSTGEWREQVQPYLLYH